MVVKEKKNKMKIYSTKHMGLKSHIYWKSIDDVIEEMSLYLVEGNVGDIIELEIVEMSEEEYENLPEFGGY